MKQPSLKKLQKQIDTFNAKYSVGDMVHVKTGSGLRHVKLLTPANILGGHSAVAWFEGISGCYSIEGIK